jgi:methyl-accepting chemotaxis protein
MFALRNMKMVHQLAMFAATIFALFLLFFGLTMARLQNIQEAAIDMAEKEFPAALLAEEANRHLLGVGQWFTDVSLTHNREGLQVAEKQATTMRKVLGEMRRHAQNESDIAAQREIDEMTGEFEDFYRRGLRMSEAYLSGNKEAGDKLMKEFDDLSEKLEKRMTIWRQNQEDHAARSAKEVTSSIQHAIRALNITILLILAIGGGFVYFMVNSLRAQAREIKEGTANLASSIAEISTTISQLTANSAETASTIHEVGTTVEEIRHIAHVANDKTSKMVIDAQSVRDIAKSGRKAAEDALSGIHDIRQEMENIAKTTVELGEHTQNIGEIIDAVNDITDQTNLLSVNASIEAAKAGEVGRGFAVVAQEMKRLTSQAKEATTQIETILGDIQRAAGRSVMAAERGGKAVERGAELANTAGGTIVTLEGHVSASAGAAEQIGGSSAQQLVGMDQLVQAMGNIKTATQQNVDGARQLEEATRNLSALAQSLRNLTQRVGG